MKRIKISLAAFAFVLATGAAFATSNKAGTTPCVDDPTRVAENCLDNNDEHCCTDKLNIEYFGDYQQP